MRLLAAVAIVVGLVSSGCIESIQEYRSFDPDPEYVNPGVFEGIYAIPDTHSFVLNPGPYRNATPVVVHLKSERPAYVGQSAVPGSDVQISLAYWLPENVTEKVPVIVDAGPYFEADVHCVPDNQNCLSLENDTIDYPQQSTPFSLQNFLPHGYAVAQVAIRGTGTSGGCMELMGPNEQADLNQAITWLATQPWSNGNVAMQGASYDGSTPWMVAATGNPHLKTIIPTSGLPDIFDLMFHNGSAENRGRLMHQFVYWKYGFSPNYQANPIAAGGLARGRTAEQNHQNLICPEAWEGAVLGPLTEVSGHRGDPATQYWRERDYRDDVLKNYKGSVFLIHGLQDWNVDPHAAIPFNQELREAGIRVKDLYGQWGHAYPDSQCNRRAPAWYWSACRYDYGEMLFRWLEHELKGKKELPLGPDVQVQDNRGFWRIADSYPPHDATWTPLYPSGRSLSPTAKQAESVVLLPPQPNTPASSGALQPSAQQSRHRGPAHYLEFRSEPFPTDVRISGLPRLHVEFEAMGPGGYLGAWLFDENATGRVLDRKAFTMPVGKEAAYSEMGIPPVIGHAQMDLRYHRGGDQLAELVPGQKYVAKMEFEPLEVLIPAGHRLTLWLFQYHYTVDHIASQVPSPVRVFLGGPTTTLSLPVVNVDPVDIFPVPGSHMPKREFFERFHVAKPAFGTLINPPSPPIAAAGCGWSSPAASVPIIAC